MKREDFSHMTAREIFLNPGELGGGFRREVFGTLLGSCVAITLWHPKRHFGCMCHFLLPAGTPARSLDGRYGETAFALMQDMLKKHGIRATECIAKIFGGGRMFSLDSAGPDVGRRNIQVARDLLSSHGLAVTAEHVGGNGYRRLYFDTDNGDVWLKFDWVDTEQKDVIL